jgi:hypothetical protein
MRRRGRQRRSGAAAPGAQEVQPACGRTHASRTVRLTRCELVDFSAGEVARGAAHHDRAAARPRPLARPSTHPSGWAEQGAADGSSWGCLRRPRAEDDRARFRTLHVSSATVRRYWRCTVALHLGRRRRPAPTGCARVRAEERREHARRRRARAARVHRLPLALTFQSSPTSRVFRRKTAQRGARRTHRPESSTATGCGRGVTWLRRHGRRWAQAGARRVARCGARQVTRHGQTDPASPGSPDAAAEPGGRCLWPGSSWSRPTRRVLVDQRLPDHTRWSVDAHRPRRTHSPSSFLA